MKILIEELDWQRARTITKKVNPEFTQIVDDIDPTHNFKIFKVRYPYGFKILRNGMLYLPTEEGGSVALDDPSVPKDIRKKISYNMFTNPVTMVVKKNLELFVRLEDRLCPYSIISPGSIFGLWRILDYPTHQKLSSAPISLWDMTSGSRSIFTLPKISDTSGLKNIQKEFGCPIEKPKYLKDHYTLFKTVYDHSSSQNSWESEVLFFDNEWVDNIMQPKWQPLRNFFLQSAWKSCEYWRNQFTWDLTFSRIKENRGIKPSPYISDIVSHLLSIAVGALPGFSPASDESGAPIKFLQSVIADAYQSSYAPIIMQSEYFRLFESECKPVYYSFNYQTSMKLSLKSSSRSSFISDLFEVSSLYTKYITDIQTGNLNIQNTPLSEAAKRTELKFYHSSNSGSYNEILSSKDMLLSDNRFQMVANQYNLDLPTHSSFLSGCIKICRS